MAKHTVDCEPNWINCGPMFHMLAQNNSVEEFNECIRPILNGYHILREYIKGNISEKQFKEIVERHRKKEKIVVKNE